MTVLSLQANATSTMRNITTGSNRNVTTGTTINLNPTNMSPGDYTSGDTRNSAIRFVTDSTITKGLPITATLKLTPTFTFAATIRYLLSCEAADNASALSSTSGDLRTSVRPRTSAVEVTWNQDSVTNAVPVYVDVTSIVTEVINRSGWSAGNAIVILIDTESGTGNNQAQDYAGTGSSRPVLEITSGSDTTTSIIATGDDDGQQQNGTPIYTKVSIQIGHRDGDLLYDAWRFNTVTFPQKATITQAYLNLRGQGSYTTPSTLTVRFKAELSPTPSALTTAGSNISGRTRTTAYVDVNFTSVTDNANIAVDITTVIQELSNMYGWVGRNDLIIIAYPVTYPTEDWQDVDSYETASSPVPGNLDIDWTIGSVSGDATANPSVVARTFSQPAPVIVASSVVSVSVISRALSLPASTQSGSSVSQPAVLPKTLSVVNPSITGTAIVSPAVIARLFSIPPPVVNLTSVVSPAAISILSSLAAAIARGDSNYTATVLSQLLSVINPSVSGSVLQSPAVLSAIFTALAPSIRVDNTVLPTVLSNLFNLLAPSVSGNSNSLPSVLTKILTVNGPTIQSTANVPVSPVTGLFSEPPVSVNTSGNTDVNVSSIGLSSNIVSPSVSGSALLTAALLSLLSSNQPVTVSNASNELVLINVVNINSALPPMTVVGNANVLTSVLERTVNLGTPLVNGINLVQISALLGSFIQNLPTVVLDSGVVVTPSTIDLDTNVINPNLLFDYLVSANALSRSFNINTINVITARRRRTYSVNSRVSGWRIRIT